MLIYVLVAQAFSQCTNYMCASSDQHSQYCVNQQDNNVFLQICDTDRFTYCPQIFPTSMCTIQQPFKYNSWPGEPCQFDMDCSFGKCISGVCKGKSEGDSCSLTDECDVGYHCSSQICQKLLSIGQKGCSEDFDCINTAGCIQGECTAYGSVKPGGKIDQCDKNYNFLCQSSYCTSDGDNLMCASTVRSPAGTPLLCFSFSDCVSTVDPVLKRTLRNGCECGYNPYGASYCQLFPGDYPMTSFIETKFEWINSAQIQKCHSKRRFSEACIENVWDQHNSVTYMYYYNYAWLYQLLEGADICAKSIYLADYMKYQELYDNLGSVYDDDDNSNYIIYALIIGTLF